MITITIIIITSIVSILGFKNRNIVYALSMNPYSVVKRKQWYRLFSCSLVHSDFTHLLVNMLTMWWFGGFVENQLAVSEDYGTINNAQLSYILLYVGGVIFSSIPDMTRERLNNPRYNSIGASGGVASIIFASVFFSPWSNIYLFYIIPISNIIFAVGYLAYSYYMGRRSLDNINHKAHFFGAIFGMLYLTMLNVDFLKTFIDKLIDWPL